MSVLRLPDRPSLEQLRNQAKDLRRAVQAGAAGALAEVAEHDPAASTDPFTLASAQLVIARHYGFASWARLKHHVDLVARYTRAPDEVPACDDVADEFLRLACLDYGDDEPARRSRARALLVEHPEIAATSIHAAACVADAGRVRAFVDADPSLARREDGPYTWQPLCYLAYARHDPEVARDASLATARVLLDAGADPNAGYLWHGLPTPFTVLTGVLGGGELGPDRQPPHPHWAALARVLLEAGADPSDGQGLYNRMFEPDDEHLVLLFEHGLGTGDGGPWRARLGAAVESPAEMLQRQLSWAINHHLVDRVRLLAGHGVDVTAPLPDGRTPVDTAALAGDRELVDLLVAHGAPPAALDPADALVGAVLGGDPAAVDAITASKPDAVADARERRPSLVVWATAARSLRAVELALDLGFDVNARGRIDLPIEQPWETALHAAAQHGDVAMAQLLLARGADPTIRDARFDATALGWAEHFDQPDLVALLTPVTPNGAALP
jgi:hypothetical protein